jgi:putative ABC transport system permease protein
MRRHRQFDRLAGGVFRHVGWLQNYAYRTSLNVAIFFLAAVLAIVIVLITVSYQAIKTALANPVEALRYE